MVDYNDGKWHGWNGGECPVHEESVVECMLECGHIGEMPAGWWTVWGTEVVAFRVVKQYIEPPKPREFWVLPEGGRCFKSWPSIPGAIHVREVLE